MDLFLIILAGILVIMGFLGSILPVLPGIPLSYLGIICLHITNKYEYSSEFLIFWAIIVIIIQLLDYIIPIWGTKKFGGSKIGIWGSSIGLIVGLFMGPFGIILGPFLGAFVGELMANKNTKNALKAAFGSFIGIFVGTILKLMVAGFLIYYYIVELIKF